MCSKYVALHRAGRFRAMQRCVATSQRRLVGSKTPREVRAMPLGLCRCVRSRTSVEGSHWTRWKHAAVTTKRTGIAQMALLSRRQVSRCLQIYGMTMLLAMPRGVVCATSSIWHLCVASRCELTLHLSNGFQYHHPRCSKSRPIPTGIVNISDAHTVWLMVKATASKLLPLYQFHQMQKGKEEIVFLTHTF